jgi:hypothetical protein
MSDYPAMDAASAATVKAGFFYKCLTNRCCWSNYYRLDSNCQRGVNIETIRTNKMWRALHDGIGL